MGYRTLRVAGGVTFWLSGAGKSVLEVVVSSRACVWSLVPSPWAWAGCLRRRYSPCQAAGTPLAVLLAVLPAALLAVLRVVAHDSRWVSFPRMSHAIPPHCVAPRNHIVGIATFVDIVESSLNRIACEPAPSALAACVPRRARGPDTSRVGPMVCAWVRHFVRGSDGMRGRRSGAYLGVGVRVMGLTRIVGDSRASDAPGQAPLRPSRRAPCPRHPVVGVCRRGGLRRGRRCPEARPHRQ